MASVKQGPESTKGRWKERAAWRWERTKNFTRSLFSGPSHDTGMRWLKEGLGLDPRTKAEVEAITKKLGPGAAKYGIAKRLLNLNFAFTAYEAYSGYKEGGIWGAAKGAGQMAAMNYAMGRVFSMAGRALGFSAFSAGLVGAGVIGGAAMYSSMAGVGFSKAFTGFARPQLHDFYRKHAKLELGSPILDPFGTGATMRQRSVMAIQNSKINGRSALGQESQLLASHYAR